MPRTKSASAGSGRANGTETTSVRGSQQQSAQRGKGSKTGTDTASGMNNVKSEVNANLKNGKITPQYQPHPQTVKSGIDGETKSKRAVEYTQHPKTVQSERSKAENSSQKNVPKWTEKDELKSHATNKTVEYTPHPNTLQLERSKAEKHSQKNVSECTGYDEFKSRSSKSHTTDTTCTIQAHTSVEHSSHKGKAVKETFKSENTDRQKSGVYERSQVQDEKANDGEGASSELRVYKDNRFNRHLGRVGQTLGSCVYSRKTNTITQQTYTNNAFNRKEERVGMPRGSMPAKKSATTRHIPEILEKIVFDELEAFTIDYQLGMEQSEKYQCALTNADETMVEAFDLAMCQYNRRELEMSWQRQSEISDYKPKTLQSVLEDYVGRLIPFPELRLQRKIGLGGFGEVYFGKWGDSVVAVKKLKETKLSNRDITRFAEEIMNFCSLDHPNIVKFIGACTDVPNFCIVMEYMQMSLHDGLHVRNDINFNDFERTSIIKQACGGVKYLHGTRIAHCDLKTMNVLLDYVEDHLCEVKITDFGLSMVKACAYDSSDRSNDIVRNAGTPRYSAPEVLRGEMLDAKEMMRADVYSLSLLLLEVLFEQEPFPDYDRQKIKERVGQQGEVPEFPDSPQIDRKAKRIIERAWSFEPEDRPDIAEVCDVFRQTQNIYDRETSLNIFN